MEDSAENKSLYLLNGEEEDDVWLGEPSAHLNHVVAYHQVVREQMQATVKGLEKVHKEVSAVSRTFLGIPFFSGLSKILAIYAIK